MISANSFAPSLNMYVSELNLTSAITKDTNSHLFTFQVLCNAGSFSGSHSGEIKMAEGLLVHDKKLNIKNKINKIKIK